MTTTPTLRVLSLGAGVQSTTLLMLAADGTLPKVDAAIFSDTGWEPAAVYEHLDRLEREVAGPAGIPVYRVSNGNLRDDTLNPNKMRSIPAYTKAPDGSLGMLGRKCTQQYKLRPILEQVRLLLGAKQGEELSCRHCGGEGERVAPWRAKRGEDVMAECSVCDGLGTISRVGQPPKGVWAEQWIGFSTDEIERVSTRGDTRYSKSRHPLLELGMSRTQCEAYLKHHGWTSVAKSACVGCPFHGNAEWRRLRDTCLCGHHRDQHVDIGGRLLCDVCPHDDPRVCTKFTTPEWDDAVAYDREYRNGLGMTSQRFLHISCEPLDTAPIDRVQRREFQMDTFFDLEYEEQLERAEKGDPDGCSPWACRSGSPVASEEAAR